MVPGMAARQTRVGVTLNAGIFERLRTYCDARGFAKAAIVEEIVVHYLAWESEQLPWPPAAEMERRARMHRSLHRENGARGAVARLGLDEADLPALSPPRPPAFLMVGAGVGEDVGASEGRRLQGRLASLDSRLAKSVGEQAREPLEKEREAVLASLRVLRDRARSREGRR